MLWYFPKGIFPRATSQVTISQATTYQVCLRRSLRFLAAALGTLAHSSRSARPPHRNCSLRLRRYNLTFGKLSLGKLHIWKIATCKTVTWEVPVMKIP